MRADGAILELGDGRLTTARMRALEHGLEQRAAVETLTGRGRGGALIGQAGTGKGVVIDAAARA